ncbi:monooxygenase, FAD-binding (plasmid) [Rhizorhabdus wittichii RW1]|uniref:Monooxygenase, FAD-binding n=1 Tax=Rhizorhabdus wittichii (strain DSM 6014 / CCUG 31198 / JCM 15750 / NBRC 105917 / EY 4224 / RW1) TaxID=392499 RepID=A0A9J9HH73_RHIWR|nr:monooxygenase, FAD-binding [Rhizorhabdus wittichii RW1]
MTHANEAAKTSALIVGAGSSGMAAALELARHGIVPMLIDASPEAQQESRGTGLQARTLELLDMHGVSDRIVALGTPIRSLTQFRDGMEIGRVHFALTPSRFATAPALPQYKTEGALRERLAEYGVVPEWGQRLVSLEQDGQGVRAVLESENGERVVHADYVIGCDGARSTVRKLINQVFEGTSYPEGWGLLDVTLDWDLSPDEVRVFRIAGSQQQFVVTPFGGNAYRVQADHRPEAIAREVPTIDEMCDLFRRHTGLRGELSNPQWASAFNIHRRQVVNYRDGRVFLAGDAAHIHTPAGGQGLNTGIQDGLNLGWKMALVLRGDADPSFLDSYEEERKPVAAGVLELSEILARTPEGLFTNAHFDPVQVATRVGQLLVNYREGPLGQSARGEGLLQAGDRIPDIEIEGESLYRKLAGGGFVVVLFDGAGPASPADDAALVRKWSMAADGALATALGGAPGAVVLRPDGYLGVVFDGDPVEAFAAATAWIDEGLKAKVASREKVLG